MNSGWHWYGGDNIVTAHVWSSQHFTTVIYGYERRVGINVVVVVWPRHVIVNRWRFRDTRHAVMSRRRHQLITLPPYRRYSGM